MASLLIPLSAHLIDAGLHPVKQGSCVGAGNAQALQLENFPLRPVALAAPIGDFLPEVVNIHGGNLKTVQEQTKNKNGWHKSTDKEADMAKSPAQLSARMSQTQQRTLMDLSVEAYQPRMFRDDLSKSEAARRIQVLKAEIELANSF